jgi:hypothetical protein
LDNKTAEFVEEELKVVIHVMMQFVNSTEEGVSGLPSPMVGGAPLSASSHALSGSQASLVSSGTVPVDQRDGELFDRVAADFNAHWPRHLATLNASVMASFPNFQNGARVLDAVFARFLQYYSRFLALWDKKFVQANPPVKRARVQPVGVQTVMVEIKKFRSDFS